MDNKQPITEDQGLQKQWMEEAAKQTLATLPSFLDKLANGYQHDYGTCVHATAAAAIGASWALNDVVGLTGFQAGGVMWEFIRSWNYSSNKCGLRILDYDNVLFPQFEDKFRGQSITPDVWKLIQQEAVNKLAEHQQRLTEYKEALPVYQQQLASYKESRPDYDERPEYYNRLSFGMGDEWQREKEKEESGFEFAPREPHKPGVHPNVLAHWQKLADGRLPFNMRVVKD